FVIGSENQAAVDVEESAGKSECVDFVGIDDLDGEWHLRIGIANEVLSDAVDVLVYGRIIDEFDLPLDFSSHLPAHSDLFFKGDEVDASLVNVAIPDIVDIAVLLGALFLCLLFLIFLRVGCRLSKGRENDRKQEDQR